MASLCRAKDLTITGVTLKNIAGYGDSAFISSTMPPSPVQYKRVHCQRNPRNPCTKSSGFEAPESIPFPGPDSIFSSRCGAVSRRHIVVFQKREIIRFSNSDKNSDNKPVGARRDASGSLTGGKRLRNRVIRAGIAGVANNSGCLPRCRFGRAAKAHERQA